MDSLVIRGGEIYLDGRFQAAELLAEDGRIAKIGGLLRAEGCPELRLARGERVVPGFVDIHTHGAAGVDVNAADADGLGTIGRFFAAQGVTAWLASILTDTQEQTLRCIDAVRAAMGREPAGARLAGIHLEGPFLSPAYRGAMPEALLRPADLELLHRYRQQAGSALRYLTVAPELPGIPALVERVAGELTVAMGHSGADYYTAMACIRAGARAATHTGNAMGPLHQREPGVLGAALESDIYCEIIADGLHLHPGMLRLILKAKGAGRVVAVTDSIMAAGLSDGSYRLGANQVEVRGGEATLPGAGVRAGSTLTAIGALRNLLRLTFLPLEELLPLFCENPARLVGLSRKGRIAPGYDADLTVLSPGLEVSATLVGGRTVYQKP